LIFLSVPSNQNSNTVKNKLKTPVFMTQSRMSPMFTSVNSNQYQSVWRNKPNKTSLRKRKTRSVSRKLVLPKNVLRLRRQDSDKSRCYRSRNKKLTPTNFLCTPKL